MKSISVVIPTYGKCALLAETLTALSRQNLSTELWDVIVVDDASADDTPDLLAAAEPTWEGRLHCVRADVNVGRAAARNLGAHEADGRWLLFLDDDVVAPQGLLRAHLEILERHPGDGTIGLVITDPVLVDAPHFHYIDTRGAAKIAVGAVPARYLVTQNTGVPRDVFLAIGGFDEAFAAYGFEDTDLGFRLEDRGVKFQVLKAEIPRHVHHHRFRDWLAKKRECGHGPLQRIADVHPRRIQDLSLRWVLDPPGRTPSWWLSVARRLGRTIVRPVLGFLLQRWPTRHKHRPVWFPLYARLMDLLVLLTYCQGLTDYDITPIDH